MSFAYALFYFKDTGQTSPRSQVTDDSDDDVSELEISMGNKDAFILEVRIIWYIRSNEDKPQQ